jgi:hypothetical protein
MANPSQSIRNSSFSKLRSSSSLTFAHARPLDAGRDITIINTTDGERSPPTAPSRYLTLFAVVTPKDKICNWLSAPEPSITLNRLLDDHHEGTGEWLLESEVFTGWKGTPAGVLWVNGMRELSIYLLYVT